MTTNPSVELPEIPQCQCVNRVYRYKLDSLGRDHWGTQCLLCGKFFPCKKIEVPLFDRDVSGEFDPGISERYQEHQEEVWREYREAKREAQHRQKLRDLSDYYQTDHWRKTKRRRHRYNQNSFNGFCEMCFERKATHIHHMTYDRLWNEWIFDLAAICEECHVSLHPHMGEGEEREHE